MLICHVSIVSCRFEVMNLCFFALNQPEKANMYYLTVYSSFGESDLLDTYLYCNIFQPNLV